MDTQIGNCELSRIDSQILLFHAERFVGLSIAAPTIIYEYLITDEWKKEMYKLQSEIITLLSAHWVLWPKPNSPTTNQVGALNSFLQQQQTQQQKLLLKRVRFNWTSFRFICPPKTVCCGALDSPHQVSWLVDSPLIRYEAPMCGWYL